MLRAPLTLYSCPVASDLWVTQCAAWPLGALGPTNVDRLGEVRKHEEMEVQKPGRSVFKGWTWKGVRGTAANRPGRQLVRRGVHTGDVEGPS